MFSEYTMLTLRAKREVTVIPPTKENEKMWRVEIFSYGIEFY